jgi:hypothetical protein
MGPQRQKYPELQKDAAQAVLLPGALFPQGKHPQLLPELAHAIRGDFVPGEDLHREAYFIQSVSGTPRLSGQTIIPV